MYCTILSNSFLLDDLKSQIPIQGKTSLREHDLIYTLFTVSDDVAILGGLPAASWLVRRGRLGWGRVWSAVLYSCNYSWLVGVAGAQSSTAATIVCW
jgi:hypothetical protein